MDLPIVKRVSLLEESIAEGESPVCHLQSPVYGMRSESW